MEYSKRFNGKRFYWYGWTSVEEHALDSQARLTARGKLVIIEEGVGKYPNSAIMGWNIWQRPNN